MKNHTCCSDREKLERLFHKTEQSPIKSCKLLLVFTRLWQSLSKVFKVNDEPYIRLVANRGQTWWLVDDSLNNQFLRFYSEQEVRIWLEERYYRRLKRSNWNLYRR